MSWHGVRRGQVVGLMLVAVAAVVAGCSSTPPAPGSDTRQAFYQEWEGKLRPLATAADARDDCQIIPSEPCSEALHALVDAADQLQTEIAARPDKGEYADVTSSIATMKTHYTNFTDNARCTAEASQISSLDCPILAGGLSQDLATIVQNLSLVT
jgi:hypothetical protein